MQVPLIYRARPIFGFDLGTHTAKMVQLRSVGKRQRVMGYGYADIPAGTVVEGIVVDPEQIAGALRPLLKQMSYGKITAGRVAVSLPSAKVFTRLLQLPPMKASDLDQAVQFEAEQYIPVPLPDLYIDHEILRTTHEHTDVLMVAAPRAIVDSYIKLFDLLGLEIGFVESSLAAVTRAVTGATTLPPVTMIGDFGSLSLDLTVYDDGMRLTNSVALGGDQLTASLVAKLSIDERRAKQIKTKYGLAKSGLQTNILTALEPQLNSIVSEVKRVAKYYEERSEDKQAVETLLLTGGSAAMPGLIDYLASKLELKVELANPWSNIEVKGIQNITKADIPLYATAIGLAKLDSVV